MLVKDRYMRNRLIGLLVVLTGALQVYGQRPLEAFLTMPMELCPYFNEAQRNAIGQELVVSSREKDSTVLQPVPNLFGSESRPLSLTDKSMCLAVAEGVEYDWLVENNTIIFIQTLCSPVCSSVVAEYDMNWQFIRLIRPNVAGVFVRAYIEDDRLVFVDMTPDMELGD